MLLWRAFMSQASVYEIQESGEARIVHIKAPPDYEMGQPIRSDRNWLLRFRKPNANGVPDAFVSLLEVDPQNGEPLREYRVKQPDKLSETTVSCFSGGEFWGVRHDANEGDYQGGPRNGAALSGKVKQPV